MPSLLTSPDALDPGLIRSVQRGSGCGGHDVPVSCQGSIDVQCQKSDLLARSGQGGVLRKQGGRGRNPVA